MLFSKKTILLCVLVFGVSIFYPKPAGALFRGDEYDQRDYTLDAEYYVDLLPILPNMEERLLLWTATNVFVGGAGSYTRTSLFNQQRLKLDIPIAPSVNFLFDFIADQDYDGIYQHHLLGLGYALSDTWNVALVGEPLARKEYADIGAAFRRRAGRSTLNFTALWPEFSFDRKNDFGGNIEKKPVNLQMDMLHEVSKRWDFFVQADVDFPSQIRYEKPEFTFDYESWKPSAGVIWRKTEDEMWWCEIGTEDTDKERRSFTGMAPDDFRTTRRMRQARVEYVRYPAGRNRFSIGAKYLHLDEDNQYPNKPQNPDLLHELEHTTRMLYGTVRRPIARSFYVETGLILDYAWHKETYPLNVERQKKKGDVFEGKIPLSLGWQGGRHRFDAGLSVQVDDVAFGGGYVTGIVVF